MQTHAIYTKLRVFNRRYDNTLESFDAASGRGHQR
jgi:hypothetical protein